MFPHNVLKSLLAAAALLSTVASAQTLTTNKARYALGEQVTVTFQQVTRDLGGPYIVLVPANARDDQDGSLHSEYLTVTPDGSLTFKGVKPGQYEARLYYASAVTGVIARTAFQVAAPDARPAAATPPASKAAVPAGPAATTRAKPSLTTLLGGWQCMTRMQAADELMFTFDLKAAGVWEDLTFRPKRLPSAKYTLNATSGVLRLNTPQGGRRYDFEYLPAAGGSKERLVEVVPQAELYRAQVCYRYKR